MEGTSVKRTWLIPVALADGINTVANRLAVWDSDLVAALLTHALADLEAGRWTLRRKPLWYAVAGDDDDPAAE